MPPTKCQAIVFSEALKRERQCHNPAGESGWCAFHAKRYGITATTRVDTGRLSSAERDYPMQMIRTKPRLKREDDPPISWPDIDYVDLEARLLPAKPGELVLARKVIAAAREFLRDPEKKGRFVAVLGDYEDLLAG